MMSYTDIVTQIGVWLVASLTVVQISPIKINPWSYVAKSLGRAMTGDLADEVKALNEKVGNLEQTVHESNAVNARVRILRFGDEVYRGQKHTKEHFDQVLSDITTYEQYCNAHPNFRNNMTALTVEHIKEVYKDCLEKHQFL